MKYLIIAAVLISSSSAVAAKPQCALAKGSSTIWVVDLVGGSTGHSFASKAGCERAVDLDCARHAGTCDRVGGMGIKLLEPSLLGDSPTRRRSVNTLIR